MDILTNVWVIFIFCLFAYLSIIYSVQLRPQLTSAKHFFWCQKRRQTITFLNLGKIKKFTSWQRAFAGHFCVSLLSFYHQLICLWGSVLWQHLFWIQLKCSCSPNGQKVAIFAFIGSKDLYYFNHIVNDMHMM